MVQTRLILAVLMIGLVAPQATLAGDIPAAGAWIVEKAKPADDLTTPGTVWILSASGIAFVQENKLMRQVRCTVRELGQGKTSFDCPQSSFVVPKPSNGRALVQLGGAEVTIRQSSPAESARYLKLVASENGASKRACELARKCCVEAMPLLGSSCGRGELPLDETVAGCEKALQSYRMLLDATKQKAPESCIQR